MVHSRVMSHSPVHPDSPAPSLSVAVRREQIANQSKHWVRVTAACNNKCVFCLDTEAQDGRFMSWEHVEAEMIRGRREKEASRLILSGGEASIHPLFAAFVRRGRELGYERVQTVTNGRRFAQKEFFQAAMDAGLGEITFSLHGHTAELHDRLVGAKGAFTELMRGMLRAVRDGRAVVNVDVVINRQNVAHLDKIVALCVQAGVYEFDLLHVIPQGAAFEHREELFYDPAQYHESLQRVFRLARHPRFHIWTNRFPLAHLEGLEELIQDPHKMLDEVGGRRLEYRAWIDDGVPLSCRDGERCPHCFIEPFCASLDGFLADQQADAFDVFWVGKQWEAVGSGALPSGTTSIGIEAEEASLLPPWPEGVGMVLQAEDYSRLVPQTLPERVRLVATRPQHLDALREVSREGLTVEVRLRGEIATWLERNLDVVINHAADWVYHGTTFMTLAEVAADPVSWVELFQELSRFIRPRSQNLPPCLCPGSRLEEAPRILPHALFHEDGRLAIDPLVDRYVSQDYRAKSQRCRTCAVDSQCSGAHVQEIRHHGFAMLQPLSGGFARDALEQLEKRGRGPRLTLGELPLERKKSTRLPVLNGLDLTPVPHIDHPDGTRRS